ERERSFRPSRRHELAGVDGVVEHLPRACARTEEAVARELTELALIEDVIRRREREAVWTVDRHRAAPRPTGIGDPVLVPEERGSTATRDRDELPEVARTRAGSEVEDVERPRL